MWLKLNRPENTKAAWETAEAGRRTAGQGLKSPPSRGGGQSSDPRDLDEMAAKEGKFSNEAKI